MIQCVLRNILDDTITRRLVITVTCATAVTLFMLQMFFIFGGAWAKPDIRESGLIEQVGTVIRMVSAAQPAERTILTHVASNGPLNFAWYPAADPIAQSLQNGHYEAHELLMSRTFLKSVLHELAQHVVVFQENNAISRMAGLPYDRALQHDVYFLGVQFADNSWFLCVVSHRLWGLTIFERTCLQLGTLALWIITVSMVASRQMSRPIEKLAQSVRQLGLQPQANPLCETGPKEIRLVAQTINGMQARIQQFIDYRTTMLAAISHDLRTPLTRIRLRGEYIDHPTQQQRLFQDVDEMQTMIDGALSFFRNDGVSEESIIFDLSGMLQTIAHEYVDQGYTVQYQGPSKLRFTGQIYALKRVFSNLVENAIKYANPPIILLERHPSGEMVITVQDDGPGIPQDMLSQVFDPYVRVDPSRNRQTGGVGLGLTSAQAIVHAHGGTISLNNRPEGGLEARVTLQGM